MKSDPFWESRYQDTAYRNHYPWSSVVSFVFRNRPRALQRQETCILEVGCGNGSNLWFCAREGFHVTGIDAAPTAIEAARDWFGREALEGEFHAGTFADLPFETSSHHLVIDRAALTFAPPAIARAAVREVHRVLVPEGRFMFTPYTDRCTSFTGARNRDGTAATLKEGGSIHRGATVTFYDETMLRDVIGSGWRTVSRGHVDVVTEGSEGNVMHSEWNIVLEKKPSDAG